MPCSIWRPCVVSVGVVTIMNDEMYARAVQNAQRDIIEALEPYNKLASEIIARDKTFSMVIKSDGEMVINSELPEQSQAIIDQIKDIKECITQSVLKRYGIEDDR